MSWKAYCMKFTLSLFSVWASLPHPVWMMSNLPVLGVYALASAPLAFCVQWCLLVPHLIVQERLVIRKIHPSLPSFKAEFTASVPLTRIRDIAHRNDIPHDFKVQLCSVPHWSYSRLYMVTLFLSFFFFLPARN